jgi:hypothetical protein
MRGGRPLRFLAVLLGGWTTLRIALLWPAIDSVPTLIDAVVPRVAAQAFSAQAPVRRHVAAVVAPRRASMASPAPITTDTPLVSVAVRPAPAAKTGPQPPTLPIQPPPLRPAPLATVPSRWAGSVWGIARGGGASVQPGGQLGGSQAGARLTYALGERRRLALAARVSAPRTGRGAELALGIDWQPGAAPVHLIAEHRIALDGGRGGPAALVVGGIDPVAILAGFRLEAYAQGGAVARDRVEPFADGAARIARPVGTIGRVRIDVGAGAWGGAQRGATRLDIGPMVALAIPVAERAVRLTIDWRQRVAGGAAPGSGPALSIGSDF